MQEALKVIGMPIYMRFQVGKFCCKEFMRKCSIKEFCLECKTGSKKLVA